MQPSPHVYAVDVGSPKRGKFAWAQPDDRRATKASSHMPALANSVAADLEAGDRVALGFECPLYFPLSDDPRLVTKARDFEGDRSWSASPGATVSATGLVEVTWILRTIKTNVRRQVRPYLSWSDFEKVEEGLFLWEAFVPHRGTSSAPLLATPDWRDARAAARAFLKHIHERTVREPRGEVVSLLGLALLHTHWSDDLTLLHAPCSVVIL